MKKLNKLISKWFVKDAEWFQFWRPQSGTTGGLIFGAIAGALIILAINL